MLLFIVIRYALFGGAQSRPFFELAKYHNLAASAAACTQTAFVCAHVLEDCNLL
ncbi:hypothetical protein ACFSKN_18250 [Mariniflexile gromovii]|uniref:Uncharacterized protein n=1 Tax=Mariniflexile gromovii TaxID=362523 RepID=A0ABS4BWI7_9FLAO|nr:hypothetical protein [Mariniflexile gromovii]MBP0904958.1 hypothetical protein [Mariniflexile gromovii]